jgi:hypothetical protein
MWSGETVNVGSEFPIYELLVWAINQAYLEGDTYILTLIGRIRPLHKRLGVFRGSLVHETCSADFRSLFRRNSIHRCHNRSLRMGLGVFQGSLVHETCSANFRSLLCGEYLSLDSIEGTNTGM